MSYEGDKIFFCILDTNKEKETDVKTCITPDG